jgi:hypothetical protein
MKTDGGDTALHKAAMTGNKVWIISVISYKCIHLNQHCFVTGLYETALFFALLLHRILSPPCLNMVQIPWSRTAKKRQALI